MQINKKGIVGIVLLVIGVILLICGIYGSNLLGKAKGRVDQFSSEGPAKGMIGRGLHGKIDEFKTPIMLIYIGSVIFIVTGGICFFTGRSK